MPYWFFAEKLSSYINMACCPSPSPISHEIQIDMVPPWLFLLLCTSIIDEVSAPLRTISSTVCSGNSKAQLYRFIRRVGKAFRSPWAVLLQSLVYLFFFFSLGLNWLSYFTDCKPKVVLICLKLNWEIGICLPVPDREEGKNFLQWAKIGKMFFSESYNTQTKYLGGPTS